ncbi:MAG: glycosyltransferase [Clostridia bacterium]|nr:glycosyltransferase [Clostridia bacterium]
MKTVDLVVPCFNEEEVLPTFVEETNKVIATLPDYSFRYILVNDGSRDNTLAVMIKLSKEYENVKYISLSRNFGKESAMYAGLEHTTADLVFVMDADLQHPPKMFPAMLKEIENGHECCALYREKQKGESFIRQAISKMFFAMQNATSKVKMPNGAVDFRVMKREMVDSILSMGEVQRFSKGIFCWVGYDTKWLPYENVERTIGTSSWSFWGLFKYAFDGFTAFSVTPLKLLYVLGILMLLGSVGTGIAMIVMAIVQGFVGYFLPVLTALLFVGGILEVSMGIIGEYLGRVYFEVKDRPIYIANVKNIENPRR